MCVRNDEALRQRLPEFLAIKKEEIVLQDLMWEDDFNASSSNVHIPTADVDCNEWKSNYVEENDTIRHTFLVENDPLGENWQVKYVFLLF